MLYYYATDTDQLVKELNMLLSVVKAAELNSIVIDVLESKASASLKLVYFPIFRGAVIKLKVRGGGGGGGGC